MLAPIWALLALVLAPAIAGLLGLSPLVAPVLGGGLTAVAALRSRPGWRRRGVIAALGAAITVWSWLALAFGDSPLMRGILVALWLPGAVGWWRRQRIRSRIVVREYPVQLRSRRHGDELVGLSVGEWGLDQVRHRDLGRTLTATRSELLPAVGEWWREMRYRRHGHRAAKRIVDDWRRTASSAGVPGCRIRTLEWDRAACTIHVDLRRGQTHKTMLGHLDALGSALAADLGTLRIQPETRMDRVRIRWAHRDPLAGDSIPWPFMEEPEVTSCQQPFALGIDEHGQPVTIRLADDEDTFVPGVKGSGKSGVLNAIIAAAAAMDDVVLWGIDPANEVELGPWGPVWDRLAGDPPGSIRELLTAMDRVVEVRLGMLRRAGIRNWEPRLGPYILLVIDELARLDPKLRAQLASIVQICRKCGIRIVAATQHPSAEDTGSGLRSQLDRVICLRLTVKAAGLIFASESRAAGWDPSQLRAEGSFLIWSRKHPDPVTARAYWLDDAPVAALAARFGPLQPALDPESAAAADRDDPEVLRGDQGEIDEPADDVDEAEEGPRGRAATPEAPADRAARNMRVRLPVLLDALRQAAGPIAGREAARRAGLPKDWVLYTGLPELERRGEAEQTEMQEWQALEAADGGVA